MTRHLSPLATSAVLLLFNLATHAADTPPDQWRQQVHIYLLGPTLEGSTGLGPLDTDLDIDAKSVFEHLDGAFLGMYAAERNGWGVFLDVVYMDLEADAQSKQDRIDGSLTNEQLTSMSAMTYRLNDQWQVLVGAMYTRVDISLDTRLLDRENNRSVSESWWDPYLGARYSGEINDKWHYTLFGTLGGGIGADLAWTASAALGYRFTESSSVTFMYRHLDYDYEDGEGRDRFKFDMAEHGPAIGWHYAF